MNDQIEVPGDGQHADPRIGHDDNDEHRLGPAVNVGLDE